MSSLSTLPPPLQTSPSSPSSSPTTVSSSSSASLSTPVDSSRSYAAVLAAPQAHSNQSAPTTSPNLSPLSSNPSSTPSSSLNPPFERLSMTSPPRRAKPSVNPPSNTLYMSNIPSHYLAHPILFLQHVVNKAGERFPRSALSPERITVRDGPHNSKFLHFQDITDAKAIMAVKHRVLKPFRHTHIAYATPSASPQDKANQAAIIEASIKEAFDRALQSNPPPIIRPPSTVAHPKRRRSSPPSPSSPSSDPMQTCEFDDALPTASPSFSPSPTSSPHRSPPHSQLAQPPSTHPPINPNPPEDPLNPPQSSSLGSASDPIDVDAAFTSVTLPATVNSSVPSDSCPPDLPTSHPPDVTLSGAPEAKASASSAPMDVQELPTPN